MPTAPEARSIGELLGDLASDSASLVRQEFALARTEVEDKLHQTITASQELVVGALVALAALIVLLDALVYGLTEAGLQRWLAALIVGVVVAGIAFLLVRKGQNDLAATRLAQGRVLTTRAKRTVSRHPIHTHQIALKPGWAAIDAPRDRNWWAA